MYEASGSGAKLACSPFFFISSTSPKSSACMGHASTQMGSLPSATRSAHPLHFTLWPFARSTRGALYGQAMWQYPQPMHLSSSTETSPVSGSLCIAVVGQTSVQAGWSQWLHANDV